MTKCTQTDKYACMYQLQVLMIFKNEPNATTAWAPVKVSFQQQYQISINKLRLQPVGQLVEHIYLPIPIKQGVSEIQYQDSKLNKHFSNMKKLEFIQIPLKTLSFEVQLAGFYSQDK